MNGEDEIDSRGLKTLVALVDEDLKFEDTVKIFKEFDKKNEGKLDTKEAAIQILLTDDQRDTVRNLNKFKKFFKEIQNFLDEESEKLEDLFGDKIDDDGMISFKAFRNRLVLRGLKT